MKILHVATSVFKAGGGTSEVVPRMCEALAAAGHEVRLVAGAAREISDAAVRAARSGVDARYCSVSDLPHVGFFRLSAAFCREIKDGLSWCDIVHVHGHWQDVNWLVPYWARKRGKPYVMQSHGFLEPERIKKSAWQKKIVGALIERPNLNRALCVVATAESEKAGIRAFGVSAPIEVVPIGLDTEKIDAASRDERLLIRLGLSPEKKTLLYFSRITPIKGLDLLAQAWAKLSEFHDRWQLCIAGPDDRGYAAVIKSEYDRMITDGSVVFAGPVYGADKFTLLKSVDAFVLPTRSENWSIAVQEALAAGLPVVCTKGAPWAIVEQYGSGRWVDIDVGAIRQGLRGVLSADDQTHSRMAHSGQRLVAENFSWAGIAEQLVGIYRACKERT